METSFTLAQVPLNRAGTVSAIDWSGMAAPEARRLRELGLDLGVGVEVMHRARLGGGPIACWVGRMTVAMRRNVAAAISVALPGAAQ